MFVASVCSPLRFALAVSVALSCPYRLLFASPQPLSIPLDAAVNRSDRPVLPLSHSSGPLLPRTQTLRMRGSVLEDRATRLFPFDDQPVASEFAFRSRRLDRRLMWNACLVISLVQLHVCRCCPALCIQVGYGEVASPAHSVAVCLASTIPSPSQKCVSYLLLNFTHFALMF